MSQTWQQLFGSDPQKYQGDVMFGTAQESAPAGPLTKRERVNGRLVIVEGETTGHAHAVCDASADLYEDASGVLWLKAPEGATVVHEDHGSVTFAPGWTPIGAQCQWQGEAKRVLD